MDIQTIGLVIAIAVAGVLALPNLFLLLSPLTQVPILVMLGLYSWHLVAEHGWEEAIPAIIMLEIIALVAGFILAIIMESP